MTAITRSDYAKTNESTWKGTRVRNLRELKNGWFTAPVGTVFVITGKQAGFNLSLADPCRCCGLHGNVSKVPPDALERVEGPK